MSVPGMLVIIFVNIFTVFRFIFNKVFTGFDDFKKSFKDGLTPDIFLSLGKDILKSILVT